MGLDMCLNRMPRHKGATAEDVSRVESFLGWLQAKFDGSEYAKCGFEEWCGCEKMPSQDDLEFYADYYKATYSEWDKEKEDYKVFFNENKDWLVPYASFCSQREYKTTRLQVNESMKQRNNETITKKKTPHF